MIPALVMQAVEGVRECLDMPLGLVAVPPLYDPPPYTILMALPPGQGRVKDAHMAPLPMPELFTAYWITEGALKELLEILSASRQVTAGKGRCG